MAKGALLVVILSARSSSRDIIGRDSAF